MKISKRFTILAIAFCGLFIINGCGNDKKENPTGFSSTTEKEFELDSNWPYESIFQEKKDLIITQIADHYNPPNANIGDPEKYYWPKALARFDKYGRNDSLANAYVDMFFDNKPFHFVLVGTSRLLCQQPKSPAVLKHRTTFLKNGFGRTDSYNPWTGEGTENHVNMSRTGGYLFAQEAIRYNVGIEEAPQRLKEMKEWLGQWSKKIFTHGTGEWNSSTYSSYNMVGWLNLYDFAEDPDVRKMARAVLDYYACELALYYSYGQIGSAEMRGGGIRNSQYSSTGYLAWLWFGLDVNQFKDKWRGSSYILNAHYADSRYRPPALAVKLANKQLVIPDFYRNSKPAYLLEQKSFIKEHYYNHAQYTLGTAYIPYGGWTGASSQIINWTLVLKQVNPDRGFPIVIGGNGMFYKGFNGRKRQPWDQLGQHKNVFLLTHKQPKNHEFIVNQADSIINDWVRLFKKDFFTRFPNEIYKGRNHDVVTKAGSFEHYQNKVYITLPKMDNITVEGNIVFVEYDHVYLALRSLGTSTPEINNQLQEDFTLLFDSNKVGEICGFVMEVGSNQEFDNYEAFKKAVVSTAQFAFDAKDSNKFTYKSTLGDEIVFQYQDTGFYKAPIVDWGYGPQEQHSFFDSPPYMQPKWPTGMGSGRVPRMWVNSTEVDFNETWPVFSGQNFKLENGMLTLIDKDEVFQINYQGDVPNFSRN